MKVKNRISSIDLFFIMVQTVVGVGLLSLPYDTHKVAGSDGWISVLLAGALIQLIVLIIWVLCKRFPNLTLFDFSKVIVGRFTGTVINILYIMYFLTVVCYIFIIFTDTLKNWILPETPAWVLFLVGSVLLIYGSVCSIKNIASLFSFFFISILLLVFITLFVYREPALDVRYLFPIGTSGGLMILKGTSDTLRSFVGFEALLFYFAFIKKSTYTSALKGASIAAVFTTVLYIYIVLLSTIMISPEEMTMTPQPVLYILSAISVHILSRLDLLFLAIWGPVTLMTIISFSFIAGMGISKVSHLTHRTSVVLFGACLFLVSILFYTMEITVIEKWLTYFSVTFSFVIPIILLLISIVFKREVPDVDEKN